MSSSASSSSGGPAYPAAAASSSGGGGGGGAAASSSGGGGAAASSSGGAPAGRKVFRSFHDQSRAKNPKAFEALDIPAAQRPNGPVSSGYSSASVIAASEPVVSLDGDDEMKDAEAAPSPAAAAVFSNADLEIAKQFVFKLHVNPQLKDRTDLLLGSLPADRAQQLHARALANQQSPPLEANLVQVPDIDVLQYSKLLNASMEEFRADRLAYVTAVKTGQTPPGPVIHELESRDINVALLRRCVDFMVRLHQDKVANVEHEEVKIPVTSTDPEVVFETPWMRDFVMSFDSDAPSMYAAILASEYLGLTELSHLLVARQVMLIIPKSTNDIRRYHKLQPKAKKDNADGCVCNADVNDLSKWCDKCEIFLFPDEQAAVDQSKSFLRE